MFGTAFSVLYLTSNTRQSEYYSLAIVTIFAAQILKDDQQRNSTGIPELF